LGNNNPNPYGGGNSGGVGGKRQRIQSNVPRGKTSHRGGGKPPAKKSNCCSMAAAVRAVKRGKFRLARRYAVMSIRLIAARVA
jgi:hypothetical protein